MSPAGVLGTRADLITDLIVIGFAAVPFILFLSSRRARRGQYRLHRAVQTVTLVVLSIILVLFEVNIRLRGDSVFLSSSLAGTPFLRLSLFIHLAIAVATFLSWFGLALLSWPRLGRVLPGSFSARHRLFGRAVMVGTVLTAVTGIELYVVAFVL
jgi:uncharacterized membrane protein YozB (DUF420 family)